MSGKAFYRRNSGAIARKKNDAGREKGQKPLLQFYVNTTLVKVEIDVIDQRTPAVLRRGVAELQVYDLVAASEVFV